MAFKYQVLLCPRPKDILLVSFNHMDAIRDFVKDTPSILSQVDETNKQLIEVTVPESFQPIIFIEPINCWSIVYNCSLNLIYTLRSLYSLVDIYRFIWWRVSAD